MKAIYIDENRLPIYGNFREPELSGDLELVDIRASALTNLDVIVAEGRHYFSTKQYPAVVGREAVVSRANGDRLFLNVKAIPVPFGSMAERAPADLSQALRVPPGVDDSQAAALGNAGLAAWLPLSWRARLIPGEAVLILGATGTTGLLAVAAASALGAGRIIAAGRNEASLARAKSLGATSTLRLEDNLDLKSAFRDAAEGEVDIVLDYLNGSTAEAALATLGQNGRMVQIGSPTAPGITLNAQLARRNCLDVLGFAYYHAPIADQADAYAKLCDLAATGAIKIEVDTFPLSRFDEAWNQQKSGGRRTVLLQDDSR